MLRSAAATAAAAAGALQSASDRWALTIWKGGGARIWPARLGGGGRKWLARLGGGRI
jgi:hypothetical protein